MSIQLDPVTKLPIWPGGVVPEHPRDRDGNLIMAPPTWVPPPSDLTPPETPPDVINPLTRDLVDELDHLRADAQVLRLRIDALEMALAVLEPKADAQELRNVEGRLEVHEKLANFDLRVANLEWKVDQLQAD